MPRTRPGVPSGTVADIYIYIYIENAHATPPHPDGFCVWVAQAICLVSVVFDRWVAHEYVCDYRFWHGFSSFSMSEGRVWGHLGIVEVTLGGLGTVPAA